MKIFTAILFASALVAAGSPFLSAADGLEGTFTRQTNAATEAYKVECKSTGDVFMVERKDGKWYLDKTDLQISDKGNVHFSQFELFDKLCKK
jgi:hypothetical protein